MDRRALAGAGAAAAATGALLARRRRRSRGLVRRAATIALPPEHVARRWSELGDRSAEVRFEAAPGERGTEVVLEARGVPPGEVEEKLRRFKQLLEAGEIARSDAASDGRSLVRRLLQRAAQPTAAR